MSWGKAIAGSGVRGTDFLRSGRLHRCAFPGQVQLGAVGSALLGIAPRPRRSRSSCRPMRRSPELRRHCEGRSDEAISCPAASLPSGARLLGFARNDKVAVNAIGEDDDGRDQIRRAFQHPGQRYRKKHALLHRGGRLPASDDGAARRHGISRRGRHLPDPSQASAAD